MKVNKPKMLVFSGSCYSGKTTSINIIKKILESKNKKVIFLSELIRKYNIVSIDKVRDDSNDYMELQNTVVNDKINSEKKAIEEYNKNTYVLIDRSITDSLFYLTFYINKSSLDKEHKKMFIDLFNTVNKYLDNINNVYDYVFEFKPILNKTEIDKYRPENLNDFQSIEYEMIKKYNGLYFKENKNYFKVDLNEVPLQDMEEYWKNVLEELKIC